MQTNADVCDQPPWEVVDADERNSINNTVAEYSSVEAGLADLRARFQGVVFDLTTTAGDKAAQPEPVIEPAPQPEPQVAAPVDVVEPVVSIIPADIEITELVARTFGVTLLLAAERIGMYDATAEINRIRSTQ